MGLLGSPFRGSSGLYQLLRLLEQEQRKKKRLAKLAQRPARIHPYFPDKARSPPR